MTVRWRLCWLLAYMLAAPAFAQDQLEAPAGSIKEIATDIVRDQKQIWTSPFRMTRRNAKWWLILGGVTGALIATDHRSAQQLPNTADQLAFSRHISQMGAEYTLIPIAGGFYLTGALTRQSKLRDTGLLAGCGKRPVFGENRQFAHLALV